MIFILLIPILSSAACYQVKDSRLIGYISLMGALLLAGISLPTILSSAAAPVEGMNGMLYMDALSGYIMALVVLLGLASAVYSIGYLEHELQVGLTDPAGMRRYYALFHLFIFTMLLVTMANNLALMWIAVEATTIVSAVLIGFGFRKRALAIEAAWKYIILCTVGITFALLGTFITYYASTAVIGNGGALEWTVLRGMAGQLNPSTMKLAFIFILVGYGTKAGLAPVHNWLPDAHSQAPSPISALLSGILLNTSFYGIIRYVSLVEPSTGKLFTGNLLMLFGLISVGISSIFILVQDNYKRLLAYSSIEHMGIISLGVGIGGPIGMYGALLHILNHALSKPLMFFASGKIQGRYGSTRIENVSGVLSSMPLLGTLTFIGALSLAGTPPLNIFISEFTILKAGVDRGLWLVVGLFLFFTVIVFYGILHGFGRMLFNTQASPAQSLQRLDAGPKTTYGRSADVGTNSVMLAMALCIVILGFTVPGFIDTMIRSSIAALGVK
ncbi:MAG: hydrogenase 4 subunit F [Thermodesulfovibrionales bacterium]